MYKIIRFYFNGTNKIGERGLTLQEAQAHCRRDDTHGVTDEGEKFFDGYEEE